MNSNPTSPGHAAAKLGTHRMLSRLALDADIELAMPSALSAGEFTAYYQPLVSSSGEIRGCEALMRWRRADGSFISPAEFIPVAERNGFITDLGAYVLHEAVAQLRHFGDAGLDNLYMSVNVSPRQLENPDFELVLENALREAGVEPERLVLEITEGMPMADREQAQLLLDRIASMGVRIALDDYGTGYAGLGYLKNYPVSALKIDRSFIEDIADNKVSGIMVQAIVDLSRALHLDIIAEGVETDVQAQALHAMGVDYLQGYLFGKPMSPAELVERYKPTAAALN